MIDQDEGESSAPFKLRMLIIYPYNSYIYVVVAILNKRGLSGAARFDGNFRRLLLLAVR